MTEREECGIIIPIDQRPYVVFARSKRRRHFFEVRMKHKLSPALATLLLLLTAMIWGLAFSAQKAAGAYLSSFSLVCLRSVIATPALLLVVCFFDKTSGNGRRLLSRQGDRLRLDITRTEWVGGILCGLTLGAGSILQQFGITANENAGKTAFITSLYIVFVPLIALFFGRRTTWQVLLGVSGAVLGAFVLAFDFSGETGFYFAVGDLFVLACAVGFALQIIVIDRFSPKTDGVRMSAVQFFTCALVTLPPALLLEGECFTLANVFGGILPLLYLGIFSSGVGYTLQIVAQKRVHPAVACSVLSLESVFGLLGGILFGEMPKPQEWLGCAILFLSVIYTQLVANKKEKTDA